MAKKIEFVKYIAIKYLLKLLSLFPRSALSGLAVPLGRIWYAVDSYHRRIATDNMLNAFQSEFSAIEIDEMVKKNFKQTARVILEIPSLLNLRKTNLDSYVTFSGQAHLTKALKQGKGALILSAHFGNWEIMTVASAMKFDTPINAVVRRLDSSAADKALSEIRSITGNVLINYKKSRDKILTLITGNQVIGILLDQNCSWYEGAFVPLFGRIACTNKGLAVLAMIFDIPVIPAFNIRQPDGRYKVIFEAPVPVIKRNDNSAIVQNTALFNQILEKYIRKAPDNWFWVHRRWRLKDIPKSAKGKILASEFFTPSFKG